MDIYRQVEKRSGASGWRWERSGKEERVERGGVGKFRDGGAEWGEETVELGNLELGSGEREEKAEWGNIYI